VVDYEAEYEVDYLDWEVFCGIKAVGGVLFPQRIHQFVVTSDKDAPFGILLVHELHQSSCSVA